MLCHMVTGLARNTQSGVSQQRMSIGSIPEDDKEEESVQQQPREVVMEPVEQEDNPL